MVLQNITLTHFKNHTSSKYSFSENLNCILGNNGIGKTNLLDGIYYLVFTKSVKNGLDKQSIQYSMEKFTIYGEFSDFVVAIGVARDKQKSIKINGKEIEKLRDILGKVSLVAAFPDDTDIIRGGSSSRRKFFDGALSQINLGYLGDILNYAKLLKQRNSFLKRANLHGLDKNLLQTYDDIMIPLSLSITKRRQEILNRLEPYLMNNYTQLHDTSEVPALSFITHVDESFEVAFKKNIEKDLIMQRTLLGCHRDDILFLLDGEPLKKSGSQGQWKTFILALKFAFFDLIKEMKGIKPMILLDDVFDKLDDDRIAHLIALLSDSKRFGQIFITDSRVDRSKQLFSNYQNVQFIEIK